MKHGDYKLKKMEEARIAFEKYKKEKVEIIENNLPLKGTRKAKIYYPITKLLLYIITKLNGEHIYYLNDKDVDLPEGRTVIYANTHRFKPDLEKITLSTGEPTFMVASDFKNSYKTISGWYFNTRPTIFVDPYSKEDKNYTYEMMVRYLKEGNNGMIFPEAVWNLSPNKISLDTFFGTVRAALESNSVIVCTAIERYGKDYIINRNGYFDPKLILQKYTDKSYEQIKSDPKYVSLNKQIIMECNSILREILCTLTFEIWKAHSEKFGLESRKDIGSNYWSQYIDSLVEEWPGYKLSDNIEQQFQNRDEIEQQQVEEDINNLKNNLNENNLFLFTDYDRYLKAMELVKSYSSEDGIKVKSKKK